RERLDCDVRDDSVLALAPPRTPLEPVSDLAEAVRAALEVPVNFPALRRALTPDDHVTIVVDENLPHLVELLSPILEHISQAQIAPSAITLLCQSSASGQEWRNNLPVQFQDVRFQVHAPGDRKQLSYLATMKGGRRLYLNRS